MTDDEKTIIQAYMQAVYDKMTLSRTVLDGEVWTVVDGELLSDQQVNERYGKALNNADDALREVLRDVLR